MDPYLDDLSDGCHARVLQKKNRERTCCRSGETRFVMKRVNHERNHALD
jgi:hypothetical protein